MQEGLLKSSATYNDNYKDECISTYLKEIGEIPLLTPEEEHLLAKEVVNGNSNAKEKFIKSNLRLVVNIARGYIGRGIDYFDLIQEGNLGLIEAISRFDPDRGFRFSTYATPWINKTIRDAICANSRSVKLPISLERNISKYRRVSLKIQNETCREPTIEEIAEGMGISKEKVMEIELANREVISLNSTIDETDDLVLETAIVCSDRTMEDILIDKKSTEIVLDLFDKIGLSDREKMVLILRNGFDSEPMTLEAISHSLGISRERIRQLEARALRKLKKSQFFGELVDCLESKEQDDQSIKIRKL